MSFRSKLSDYLLQLSPAVYKKRYFRDFDDIHPVEFINHGMEPELIWVRNFLSPDKIYIDVGVCDGRYLKIAEEVLSPMHIYGFEPNLWLFKRLRKLFPNEHLFPFALSDKNGHAPFKVPIVDGEILDNRATLRLEMKEIGEQKALRKNVIVRRFDDWAEQNGIDRIDLMRIDVEGNEAYTFSGMVDSLLKMHPVLLLEMDQRKHERPIWEYIKYFERFGYSAHYLNAASFELAPLTEEVYQRRSAMAFENVAYHRRRIIFMPRQ